MKYTNTSKKHSAFLFILLFVIGLFPVKSQVTQNFESGNTAVEIGNCWQFDSAYVSNTTSIDGQYSLTTNTINSNTHGIISPFIDISRSYMKFSHRLSSNSGTNMTFSIKQIADNGTETTIYTHNYSGDYTTTRTDSILLSSKGIYQYGYEFAGINSNARGILDNLFLPGFFACDIFSNNGWGFCPVYIPPTDSDNDGVSDDDDDFPNDANRAYTTFLPNSSDYATIAFEDLWPAKGDWDFNDLVIDYQFNLTSNANDEIVEMEVNIVLRAIGAGFHNSFAFELLNIPPSKITSVSGYQVETGGIYSIGANGLENNQTNATIIVFDDAYNILQHPGDTTGINTIEGAVWVEPDTLRIDIKFFDNGNAPVGGTVKASTFSLLNNYNPFIVINQLRGRELHQANFPPTDLATTAFFGTLQDDSNPASGKYYKTVHNLPWVIHSYEKFDYPKEKADISKGYLKFKDWVQSSGASFQDWYKNLPGYRDVSKIYNK